MDSSTKRKSSKRSPLEKLKHRIQKEFEKCTYIGDIKINDEEFDLLMDEFRKYVGILFEMANKKPTTSQIIAVALVQIGIRYYDGSLWPHVKRILNIDLLNGVQQGIIGRCFIDTLKKYDKIHVEEHELRNNILMHCFITKYYADDLFDFLFAYYQIDLDRDLSRNDRKMRDLLMSSMQKGENSSRAYKIKRHTADAVSVNERGCKIRVARILRFIDNALFENSLPVNSQNRISQLFVEWANNSAKFNKEKKHMQGLGKRGKKRYSTPYIHFNIRNECFEIVIPSQYIMLNIDEELPDIKFIITIGEKDIELSPTLIGSVTGCKTEKQVIKINPIDIFSNIKLTIVKNEDTNVRNFIIKKDQTRFFDTSWEMLHITEHLPTGSIYAFTNKNNKISSHDILDKENIMGLDLYSFHLSAGDILKLSDGRILSAGKRLEEGLLPYGIVNGASLTEKDSQIPIYSKTPTVYFRMNESKEKGTIISINNNIHRFDLLKIEKFDNNNSAEKEYLLNLSGYISEDGVYDITIDIPNNKKKHHFTFSLIKDLSFDFKNAPYIFKSKGVIEFNDSLSINPAIPCILTKCNPFEFEINNKDEKLSFEVKSKDKQFIINIDLPIFKWKFDDDDWQIQKPKEIWHKEFPKWIYLKYPADEVKFSMPPIILDDIDDDEEFSFFTSFAKSKESDMFVCDTRKMFSWFGADDPIRPLSICFDESESFVFANVFTRCFILDSNIVEDREKNCLIIKSDIVGLSDCAVDVYFNEELIAEKKEVTTGGVKLYVPFSTGRYKAIFYEWEDVEDDFGLGFSDYKKFEIKNYRYINRNSITGKNILIQSLERSNKSSVFGPDLFQFSNNYVVTDIKDSAEGCNCYEGYLSINNDTINVFIELLNNNCAYISFYSDEDECYLDFLYNKAENSLEKDQDPSISNSQAKKIYEFIEPDIWKFNIKIIK